MVLRLWEVDFSSGGGGGVMIRWKRSVSPSDVSNLKWNLCLPVSAFFPVYCKLSNPLCSEDR
jgi:hypothetical protein